MSVAPLSHQVNQIKDKNELFRAAYAVQLVLKKVPICVSNIKLSGHDLALAILFTGNSSVLPWVVILAYITEKIAYSSTLALS